MKSLNFSYNGNFEQWESNYPWFHDLLSEYNSHLAEDEKRVRKIWGSVLIICRGNTDRDQAEKIEENKQLAQNLKSKQALLQKYQTNQKIYHAQCSFEFQDETHPNKAMKGEVIKISLDDFDFSRQLIDTIINTLLDCDINSLRLQTKEEYTEHVIKFCQRYYDEYSRALNNPRVIALFTLFYWYQQRGFSYKNENQFLRFIWEIIHKFGLLQTENLTVWEKLRRNGKKDTETDYWNSCRGVLKTYYSKCADFDLYISINNHIDSYENMPCVKK